MRVREKIQEMSRGRGAIEGPMCLRRPEMNYLAEDRAASRFCIIPTGCWSITTAEEQNTESSAKGGQQQIQQHPSPMMAKQRAGLSQQNVTSSSRADDDSLHVC
jgi:hypothetical protein